MSRVLITPSTAVFPAGAGTCTPTAGPVATPDEWPAGYAQEQAYTYTAIAADGYAFVRFEIRGTMTDSYDGSTYPISLDTTANPYTATHWDESGAVYWFDYSYIPGLSEQVWVSALTVTAVFEARTSYTITASASPTGDGTVKVGNSAAGATSSETAFYGDQVTVVATPAQGCRFVGWSDGGAQTHTVTQYASTIDLTAYFHRYTHLLVNSSNFTTPVQLVYDDVDGTDLLVADY